MEMHELKQHMIYVVSLNVIESLAKIGMQVKSIQSSSLKKMLKKFMILLSRTNG